MKAGFSYITEPARRHVGLSVIIGIIVGIIGSTISLKQYMKV